MVENEQPKATPLPAATATPITEPEKSNAPDTVRQRKKKNPKMATQRFLPIAEIRNDTVILKNGGLRAVIEVESMNFNLKSESEQQGIIAGYQSFINSLSFPVQISMMSRRVNIDPYIADIRAKADEQKNDLLRRQALDYADFIQKIIDLADIMQKRFYIIVPLDDMPPRRSPFTVLFQWLGIDDTQAKAIQRYRTFMRKHAKLKDRLNLVESGLNSIGLATRRMTTHELIELYYKAYNPETSHHQPLRGDTNTSGLVL